VVPLASDGGAATILLRCLRLTVLFLFCATVLSGQTIAQNGHKERSQPAAFNASATPAQETVKYPAVTINDTEMRHLKSQYTGENYEIDVFLPQGYRQGQGYFSFILVRIGKSDVRGGMKALEAAWKEVIPDYPFQYTFLDQDFNDMYRAE
jgi:hypothetical protein